MNREEKTQLLGELNELFNSSEIIVVSHYKGLTVKEVSELRDKIRKAGAGFRVTKNRITRLALKGTKFEGLTDLFTGPTAIAFANDPVSACKACVQFAKDNEKLIVVGGAMGTGVLSVAEINKLATIPSMDELRAKIIGLLQAPGAQLARVTRAYSELSIIVYARSAGGFLLMRRLCGNKIHYAGLGSEAIMLKAQDKSF